MSMVAIFACSQCKLELECGRFRGDEMNVPEGFCERCERRVKLHFVRYKTKQEVESPAWLPPTPAQLEGTCKSERKTKPRR